LKIPSWKEEISVSLSGESSPLSLTFRHGNNISLILKYLYLKKLP